MLYAKCRHLSLDLTTCGMANLTSPKFVPISFDLVEEDCIAPTHSVQACIRTPLDDPGYNIFYARDVMNLLSEGSAKKIKATIGDMPV